MNIPKHKTPPMPRPTIKQPTTKEIKTIAEFYTNTFDDKVNAAIADGYILTKRTVITPNNSRERTYFYAELERTRIDKNIPKEGE